MVITIVDTIKILLLSYLGCLVLHNHKKFILLNYVFLFCFYF